MATISTIDIDPNLSKCKVNYVASANSFFVDKKSLLKALMLFLCAVTFILACRGVDVSKRNANLILPLVKSIKSFSNTTTSLKNNLKKKLGDTNAEIEKLKDQLDVFKYDKHCPMRWIIISGICYYFSTKSVGTRLRRSARTNKSRLL